jgi:hypothetical protein
MAWLYWFGEYHFNPTLLRCFRKTSEKVLSFEVATRIIVEEHFLLSLSTNH